MLTTHTERPRELKWYHAGPMLYGDWGTSRFYVLGLALFFALHASFWYVFAVGMLVAAVGWAYTIICRCYPDGGGVYSAARHSSQQLAVVGALLLFADYIVTAALSAYDGVRYMGFSKATVPYWAMGAIVVVGIINYIGPRKAGTVALVIAIATLILTIILTIFSVPHLADGWSLIHTPLEPMAVQWTSFVAVILALSGVEAVANMTGIMVPPVVKTANKAIWPVLCEVVILNIILAIAMNGLPKAGYDLGNAPGNTYAQIRDAIGDHPDDWRTNAQVQDLIKQQASLLKTTPDELMGHAADLEIEAAQEKYADWEKNPESHDRVLAVAQRIAKPSTTAGSAPEAPAASPAASPDQLIAHATEFREHIDDTQDAVLRVMAKVYVDPHGFILHIGKTQIGVFSLACGIIFGFLLLSAVNTAVADMISIQYVMARDTELPRSLTKLNVFGVPWLALIAAVGLPVAILNLFQDLETLANLYAVGVIGAIAINLSSCSLNRQMPVKAWERAGLAVLAIILIAIEATLVYQKPDARYFALFVLAAGLTARFFTKQYPKLEIRQRAAALLIFATTLGLGIAALLIFRVPAEEVIAKTVALFNSDAKARFFLFAIDAVTAAAIAGLIGKSFILLRQPVPAMSPPPLPTPFAPAPIAPQPQIPGTPAEQLDMSRPTVLVATRGGVPLLEFAAKYTKRLGGNLMVLFVRQINVIGSGVAAAGDMSIEEDADAQNVFAKAAQISQAQGVPIIPVYVVSPDVPYAILDHAATYSVESVLMGVSRQATLLRALKGDVLTQVADNLPEDIPLLIHA